MQTLSNEEHRQRRLERYRQACPAVLPSLLQCDFANLQREVEQLEGSGLSVFHLDVMDGHFVPNFTYGMPIVRSLRRVTTSMLDVHLMIDAPGRYVQQFIEAGADSISFHIEAEPEPADLLSAIRSAGVLAGLAINPSTPLERVRGWAREADFVLIMSVEAGFGGQSFHASALDRLQTLRAELGADYLLEVDGGVNLQTLGACLRAGADLCVVGSAIFGQSDYTASVQGLKRVMQEVG